MTHWLSHIPQQVRSWVLCRYRNADPIADGPTQLLTRTDWAFDPKDSIADFPPSTNNSSEASKSLRHSLDDALEEVIEKDQSDFENPSGESLNPGNISKRYQNLP